jgi:hypothetical protein
LYKYLLGPADSIYPFATAFYKYSYPLVFDSALLMADKMLSLSFSDRK